MKDKYLYIIYIEKFLQKKYFSYITIDPGARNIGWSFASIYKNNHIIHDYGSFIYIRKQIDIVSDNRFKYIYDSIENLILKYNPDFIVIEKNNYISNKYMHGEQILLRSIGAINTCLNHHTKYVVEISNIKAKSIIHDYYNVKIKNKNDIKQFVMENIVNNNVFLKNKKKDKLSQDIIDALFFSVTIFCSYLEYKNTKSFETKK
ncbi:Crossover junction endodeoxyribonuclease RuvC [bacterium AB1]|nr:Crossover junction endodeoxyribonuclease RuvC [bacterium AB1]